MSPSEVKICEEFLKGGFCDYGTPGVVMFREDKVEAFKTFIRLIQELDGVVDLMKIMDERAIDGF